MGGAIIGMATGEQCRRYIVALAVAIVLLLSMTPDTARAAAGVVGRRIAVCVAPRDASLSARSLFAAPARFDCLRDQTDFGPGNYDVLSAPLPPGTAVGSPAAIRTASVWQGRMTLFALFADGSIKRWRIDGHGMTRRVQLGAIIETVIPANASPAVRLLWRVEGAANVHGIINGAAIATLKESARSNLELMAMYAAFAGLSAALLIYNLALWGALRYRFQLAYCALVAALLLYAASSSGALAWLLPDMLNNDRIRINYAALASAAIAALAFARTFFEPRVFAGWLGRAATAASIALAVSAPLFIVVPSSAIWTIERLYISAFMIVLLLVPPTLWRAWRRRSNYLWLFALGWAAPVVFAGLRVANDFNLMVWSFWLDNSTLLAMTIEAVVSSLAIAYRIHLLSRERDEAREQGTAALLLAATDPLTGLLNRRAFLDQAIGREGDQILLLADIDHFKRVNDTIGHDGGDEVLRVFARALRAAVPADALIARIGGEEFAIVASASAGLSASAVLQSLRAERMPFDLSVTASIGTCSGPLSSEIDWKSLYRRADRALFEAKAAGRDRARDGMAYEAA